MTITRYLMFTAAFIMAAAVHAFAVQQTELHRNSIAFRPTAFLSELGVQGWVETKHESFIINFNGMNYDVDATWYVDANGNVRVIILVTLPTPDGTPIIWRETWNSVPGGRSNDPYNQIRRRLDENGNGTGIWNDAEDRRARVTINNNQ